MEDQTNEATISIEELLTRESLSLPDLDRLRKEDRNNFEMVLEKKLDALFGGDREQFIHKIKGVAGEETKNKIWEQNHEVITGVIEHFIRNKFRLPTCRELVEKTSLSRQTVQKHLQGFAYHPLYLGQVEKIRLLSSQILIKLIFLALEGDMNAARLYFQVIGKLCTKTGLNKGVDDGPEPLHFDATYEQKQMEYLSPKQRETVESIIKSVTPEPETEAEKADPESSDFEPAGSNLWLNNHTRVLNAVSALVSRERRIPTNTRIAAESGLSRKTVSRHLKEFTYQPLYYAEWEQLRSMSAAILALVAHHAVTNDMKAMKLYFQLITQVYPVPDTRMASYHQNRYLMIGDARLDNEVIKRFSPEQRAEVSRILKTTFRLHLIDNRIPAPVEE